VGVRLVGVVLVGVVLVGVADVVAGGVLVGVAGVVAGGVLVGVAGVVVGVAGVVVTPGEAVVCAGVLDATETGVERGVAAAGTVRVAAFAETTTPMTAAEANTGEPRRFACAGEFPVTATDIVSAGG
jgi:hypothetical protein